MKVINVHFTHTDNIGDWGCAPFHYFQKLINEEQGWDWRPTEDCFVIFGGGGLMGKPEEDIAQEILKSPYVKGSALFGVGHNLEDPKWEGIWSPLHEEVDVAGFRDREELLPVGVSHVPCASCIHPIFSKENLKRLGGKSMELNTVVYEHKDHPINRVFPTLPSMSNTGEGHKDFIKKISFLSMANYVITNTYHGAYWSLLLGKKVIIYRPHSTRFLGLHWPTEVVYNSSELKDAKKKAKAAPKNFLILHQQKVKNFAIKIGQRIQEIDNQ